MIIVMLSYAYLTAKFFLTNPTGQAFRLLKTFSTVNGGNIRDLL